MNKKIENLSRNAIKQITGGWGPAKLPNQTCQSDNCKSTSVISQWDFSNEEVKKLQSCGYKLYKGKLGYTAIDNTGLIFFYDDQSDRQRIEELLGKEQ